MVYFMCGTPKAEHFAVKLLKAGGVIALPTDTIYGVACDATNVNGIRKLYSVKCRNINKPLAICLGNVEAVKSWAVVEHLPVDLLSQLLPGPVTILLKCSNLSIDKTLTYDGKIAIRVPNCDFVRDVTIGLDKPLALTSANISTKPSSVKVEEFRELWGKLDGVFDGGDLSSQSISREGSTIVDLSVQRYYSVVRNGMAFYNTCSILNKFGIKLLKT